MKKTGLITLYLLLLSVLNAQNNNFQYHPTLVSVSFSGTPPLPSGKLVDYIPIRYDNNTGEFTAPQYIQQSQTKSPVAYVSGTKPKVSAKFKFICTNPNPPAKIWIRGTHEKLDANDVKFSFEAKEVPFVIGADIEYPSTLSDKAFTANRVNFYDYDFNIKWEYSLSSAGPWKPAGESVNPVYVTYKAPKPKNPSEGYDYFQTLLHHGCKYGEGSPTHASLYIKVRNYYSLKQVQRGDGFVLKYYDTWDCGNLTTQQLLATGNGQCGAWAHMFIDVFKIQGYQSTENYCTIKPATGAGFYVKTWKFSSLPGASGNVKYPYLNQSHFPETGQYPDPILFPQGYNWQFGFSPETPQVRDDVTGASPLGGQNNAHPKSRFSNHQFVRMFTQYYDPSYGVTYSNTAAMDAAMSGYVILGKFGGYWADFVRANPAGVDVTLTLSDY